MTTESIWSKVVGNISFDDEELSKCIQNAELAIELAQYFDAGSAVESYFSMCLYRLRNIEFYRNLSRNSEEPRNA